MSATWGELFVDTLRAPRAAAESVLRIDGTRIEVYLAVLLCAALGSLLNVFFVEAVLPRMVQGTPMAGMNFSTQSPITSLVVSAGSLILFANILTWVGRAFGGLGEVHDIMRLVAWQQIVLIVLQAIGFVLVLFAPVVALFYMLALFVVLIRITVNFIDVGHQLESLATSFGVLVVSILGIFFGLWVLTGLAALGSAGGI